MRWLTLILFLFTATLAASAAETNYFCVVCGKGPLIGRIWLSKWGAVCDDCNKLENHCSLCGLPIRPGDGAVKTGDGRFIEVQGTAEADPFGRDALNALLDLADLGIKQLIEKQRAIVGHLVKFPEPKPA